MRQWSIEIWLLDDQGNEVMPTVFEKATYNLHPSFDKNKQGERTGIAHQRCKADVDYSLQEAAVPDR